MTKNKTFDKTYQNMSKIWRKWQFVNPNTHSALDFLLNELRPGTLTVFAGAVAMGANCLAMIAMADFANRAPSRCPAVCIDLLDNDFCAKRMLCREAYLQTGKFYMDCSLDDINACKTALERMPIIINKVANLAALKAFINDVISINGSISMIMLCGIGALLADNNTIIQLKQLSIDMNIPVVITYILDKNVNARADYQPLLSDVPNDICKNADTIILTCRPGYYSDELDLHKSMNIWLYNKKTSKSQNYILRIDLDTTTIDCIY